MIEIIGIFNLRLYASEISCLSKYELNSCRMEIKMLVLIQFKNWRS